jgi:hypothetical protein
LAKETQMKIKGKRALLHVSMLFFALSSMADMYRWTDEQGNIHYGACPPADCEPELIEKLPDPAAQLSGRSPEKTRGHTEEQQKEDSTGQ